MGQTGKAGVASKTNRVGSKKSKRSNHENKHKSGDKPKHSNPGELTQNYMVDNLIDKPIIGSTQEHTLYPPSNTEEMHVMKSKS